VIRCWRAGRQGQIEEPLGEESTLNRLELTPEGDPLAERYYKIRYSAEAADQQNSLPKQGSQVNICAKEPAICDGKENEMKKVTAVLFMLFLAVNSLKAQVQALPNPYPVTVSVTETSGTLSWPAVPGATSYGIWRPQLDGTYGQLWEKFMTTTATTVTFSNLAPGTTMLLSLTTNEAGGAAGTRATIVTLMKPVWLSSIPTAFDPGALYTAALIFNGNPTPTVSIVDGPAGMFTGWLGDAQQDRTLHWNGDPNSTVPVILRLTNSLGTADFGPLYLTPSGASPIVPPMPSPRLTATLDGTKIKVTFKGFTSWAARVFIKYPESTYYQYLADMTTITTPPPAPILADPAIFDVIDWSAISSMDAAALVTYLTQLAALYPGNYDISFLVPVTVLGYELDYPPAANGGYTFQVQVRRSGGGYVWSNPIP